MMNKDLSLYIHIPFCAKKCRYCDFNSFNAPAPRISEYVKALKTEIADAGDLYLDRRIISIYFGGGTPSYIEQSHIVSVVELINEVFEVDRDAEITIEVNPGSADENKLKTYRDIGINRLSIGLQSMSDTELAVLGRIHDRKDFLRTYDDAAKAGFDNINVDLISAVPGQTVSSYEKSLREVCGLSPKHISAYSLQLEEGTYMFEHKDEYDWPDEETDRQMYHLTEEVLKEYGYGRYEISNYSKPGYECRHNLVYWQGGEYIGLGLSAASYTDFCRYKNTDSLYEYLAGERAVENIKLSATDRMEEYMFIGLRLIAGISITGFKEIFDKDIYEVYASPIKELCDNGLLESDGDRLRLTKRGIDISNYCLSKFIL